MVSCDGGQRVVGMEALDQLKSTEPPLFLTPSPELSKASRVASEYLFSVLNPFSPKSPFTQLLTEGFDAEQVWQQIDLQAQPLISSLRRHVRNFEKNPEEIKKQFNLDGEEVNVHDNGENKDNEGVKSESEGLDDDEDDDDIEGEGEEDGADMDNDYDIEGEEREEGDAEMENKHRESAKGVEDRFLKIKELEEYLVEDEAREYGLNKAKKNKRKRVETEDENGAGEDGNEDEDEDDEEDDELGLMDFEDNDDDDGNNMENARYEDFFGGKRTGQKEKFKNFGGSYDLEMDDEPNDHSDHQKKQSLSTHEKQLEKLHSQIQEMEKANLEPKTWTMQGEVTAAKRPKNSALEVDLDFEHNVRPAPVITEEVTASLEELIQKRVLEGQFDDVQKPPTSLTKAPREKKELDENKSKKGLAELYEDEYAQKTGLVSTTLSFSDEQKKEASVLFKKLCVKLDALSHFHFTPKPVIEDISIQANVPALAMEEVAPLAVSDAAMLAPEEVFSGKGDVKDETELTKAERKRRRAKKKRKFKAEAVKRMATKPQLSTSTGSGNGHVDS